VSDLDGGALREAAEEKILHLKCHGVKRACGQRACGQWAYGQPPAPRPL